VRECQIKIVYIKRVKQEKLVYKASQTKIRLVNGSAIILFLLKKFSEKIFLEKVKQNFRKKKSEKKD
jgi:hypothetical protein